MVYTSERWRASWYMNDIYIYNISMVYTWYIHGILHVYAVLADMSGIYLVNASWVCSVPFFIMIYLWYTMNIFWIYIVHQRHIKKVRNKPMRYWQGIPDISVRTAYTCIIPCVYTMYIPLIYLHFFDIPVIFNVYSMYIHYILYSVNTMYIPYIYLVYFMYMHNIYYVYT
jgi:hypothetical protein